MNTQTYLFDNRETIPNGLYVELMNNLKLDFDAGVPVPVPVPTRPVYRDMNKTEIVFMLGKIYCSFPQPTQDLLERHIGTLDLKDLRNICKSENISTKIQIVIR